MRILNEEKPQTPDEAETKSQRPTPRHFNPLVNYLFYTIIVFAAYAIYYLERGFVGVITLMLFFVVRLTRDTAYVVRKYEYKFAKQAAVVNLGYSLAFFIILVINGMALNQSLPPPILPDFIELTSWTPLFIMGGVFGMANIKRMWGSRIDFF